MLLLTLEGCSEEKSNVVNPPRTDTSGLVAEIKHPMDQQTVNGDVMDVTVLASDNSGTLVRVSAFLDSNDAGKLTAYGNFGIGQISIKGLSIGAHSLVAKAYNSKGIEGTSLPVTIKVERR